MELAIASSATKLNEVTLHPTSSSRHRFHVLDALRGIAAMLVVFWHAPMYLGLRGTHSAYLAVDFFYCLSGFVVAFAYERRLQEKLPFRAFAAARLIRLYPTYLVGISLGAVAFVVVQHAHLRASIWVLRFAGLLCLQVLLLPGVRFWPTRNLFPLDFPAWSIFYEVLANFGYGWIVRRQLARTSVLIGLYVAGLLLLFCFSIPKGNVDVGWGALRQQGIAGIGRVTASFTAGVLTLRLFRSKSPGPLSAAHSAGIAVLVAVILAVLLLSPANFMRNRWFAFMEIALFFPALVFLGASCQAPSGWKRLCVLLGDISYPLYLFHAPFMTLFDLPSWKRFVLSHPGVQPMIVPTVIAFTSALSVLALRLYDAPVRRWLTDRYNTHLQYELVKR